MIRTRLFFWLLCLTAEFHGVKSQLGCKFCSDNVWVTGDYGPTKPDLCVRSKKTCNQLYLDATTNPTLCSEILPKSKLLYRACCTDESVSAPYNDCNSPQDEAFEEGTEPLCYVCGEKGKYPGKPKEIIFSNFIKGGSRSCKALYRLGLSKNIKSNLCYPLSIFAREACDCKVAAPPAPARGSRPPPAFPVRRYRPDAASKDEMKESYGRRRGIIIRRKTNF